MYDVSSLDGFNSTLEFINLNNRKDVNEVLAECEKLKYLKTYPSVVRSRLREIKKQIVVLEGELHTELAQVASHLQRIKRKQALESKYLELKELRKKLYTSHQELIYAFKIKNLAIKKLEMYNELVARFEREGVEESVSSSD